MIERGVRQGQGQGHWLVQQTDKDQGKDEYREGVPQGKAAYYCTARTWVVLTFVCAIRVLIGKAIHG